jgi:hypothetical protein
MTTDSSRLEVRTTVDKAVENIKTLAEKKPDAPVKGDDFNKLLQRVKVTFPEQESAQDIAPIDGGTTMGELLFKLSVLQGAIHGWYVNRNLKDAEERNKRSGPAGGWLTRGR